MKEHIYTKRNEIFFWIFIYLLALVTIIIAYHNSLDDGFLVIFYIIVFVGMIVSLAVYILGEGKYRISGGKVYIERSKSVEREDPNYREFYWEEVKGDE